ncbi:MAG TPA: hypothetical protein VIJ39_15895 [Solirubrobacteraceae bacterium]
MTAGEAPVTLQKQLEELYGAGNVEVTGTSPYETYEIKFVGELTDLPVGPLRRESPEEPLELGPVKVKVLAEGRADGVIAVTATNIGDESANGETQPVRIADKLPPGLKAFAIEGVVNEKLGNFGTESYFLQCGLGSLSECTFNGKYPGMGEEEGYPSSVPPEEQIEVLIAVNVEEGEKAATTGASNVASVVGGGAPAATATQSLTVSDTPVPFGVNAYEVRAEDEGGAADTQAGSHPFQLTTTLGLNETFNGRAAGGLAKDLHFKLPPGLIGNPTPFPRCTLAQFLTNLQGGGTACPADTQVGVTRTMLRLPLEGGRFLVPFVDPVYNLEPSVGEPARFGFVVDNEVPVYLDTAVRTGGDYGVTVNVKNIPQVVEFLGSELTFWGVPGAHGTGVSRAPLLALPTSCSRNTAGEPEPLRTMLEADSWAEPDNLHAFSSTALMPALDGCNRLPFEPSIKVTPDSQEASKPTGLNVDVHVDQESVLSGSGLAESGVRNITVELPAGVAINPSAGDGLGACTGNLANQPQSAGNQIGYEGARESPTEPGVSNLAFSPHLPGSLGALNAGENGLLEPGIDFCANASKIGEATIHTPLLPNPLKGFAYLAAQEANPFGSVVAMYIVVEDPVSGSLVKLAGKVQLCQGAGEEIAGMTCRVLGQIVSTFEDSPQLPFEDAELHFFGGERAPLASPSRCGTYTTEASYTPWSGNPPVRSRSSFEITSGPNHSRCVYAGEAPAFSPSLTGGALSVNAGAFSPFTATFSRSSGEQNMQSIEVHLPPGLSGILTGVELCPEPQANLGECGPNSLIGETTVGVGVGGEPYTVSGGKFYLTGPYNGTGACTVGTSGCAPFGITFEVPAKAGPFDFADTKNNHPACDCVLVRGKVEVDPTTAAITITSNPPGTPDAVPTSIEGVPLEIQHVNATTTRNDFQFNPTNCSKMAVTGTIHSSEGATDTIGVPFQVTNCAVLGFKPGFKVSTSGKTSRANGASLSVKLTYPKAPFGSQANIAKIKVDLPKQLPSRLTTLQKACPAKTFEANSAGCPAASIVGHATAITPLIPVPLTGPAYFVSYGGAKFPELVIVLQGYGVTLDVHGETFINKAGITSSTFHAIPDAPVGSFELNLPQGRYSALAATGNLCKSKLAMPTAFVAQNGAEIHESTKLSVTGCPKAKTKKAKKPSKHHSHKKKK